MDVRHDFVVQTPVHPRFHPDVFTAVRQIGCLHPVGEGFLPVEMFPVSGFVVLVPGEQMGNQKRKIAYGFGRWKLVRPFRCQQPGSEAMPLRNYPQRRHMHAISEKCFGFERP